MGRPKKVIVETKTDVLDRLFKEIDPEVILAGALGAVAAAGGITPPFTALLSAIPNAGDTAFNVWKSVAAVGSAPVAIADYLGWLKTGDGKTITPAGYALMASGALEAMMMMTLVKNPETLKGIMNVAGQLAGKDASLI